MTESDDISSIPPHTDMAVEGVDADAYHLAQLGYKQELQRNFSQWSLISFGVTLTATWAALGGALAGGIYAGGPTGVVYGFILTLVGQCFVGATIAEFASSYPTTGGNKMLMEQFEREVLIDLQECITGQPIYHLPNMHPSSPG